MVYLPGKSSLLTNICRRSSEIAIFEAHSEAYSPITGIVVNNFHDFGFLEIERHSFHLLGHISPISFFVHELSIILFLVALLSFLQKSFQLAVFQDKKFADARNLYCEVVVF